MNKKSPCIQESKLNTIIEEKVSVALGNKKALGQYFTISEDLQKFVFDKVKYKGSIFLEPSFGAGHLLRKFKELDANYPMLIYELDDTIKPVIKFNSYQTVFYGDFTKQFIAQKFKTIIGNPPYVKMSTGNLYIKFIEKCFNLLADDGELIFIVPSDFIKVTSASALIESMTKNGSFTDFLFPNDEGLFEGAAVDVLVFRYEKGLISKNVVVNGVASLININNGIITFSSSELSGTMLEEKFNVYVGLVSGRDNVYRVPFGNMDVLNDKDRVDKYIFAKCFPTGSAEIDAHLLSNKQELLGRRIKKFNEKNWFEWGAPRNITSIEKHMGSVCIYVRNMTRSGVVAFLGKVQYFGGALLCLIPKAVCSDDELKKVVDFLNTKELQKNYTYSGRFKIGHKQVCNITLPLA
jgi:adenine-specific DNA-methyltransferase